MPNGAFYFNTLDLQLLNGYFQHEEKVFEQDLPGPVEGKLNSATAAWILTSN